MVNNLFYVYYISIVIAFIAGIIRYKDLDTAMRIIVILLLVTAINECCAYVAVIQKKYAERYMTYHIYNIMQAFLFSAYFIYAIKPNHYRKLIILSAILCPLTGVLNIIFLQAIDTLNSNMLMVESCCFITISLYFIYHILKAEQVENIFRYPHFQIAVLCLVEWSSTIFFWAFINVLSQNHWRYMKVVASLQLIIETIVYLGIAATLYFYNSNIAMSEKRG